MAIWVGTSGFSYAQWKGGFYPAKVKQTDMLGIYSERFDAVEVNNTFYRMPRKSVMEAWATKVPSDFRVVLKASGRITHQQRLANAAENVRYLYEQAAGLGERLGGILFQCPPYLRKSTDTLREFLDLLPADARAIFEFRHKSWFDDEVFGLLRDAGASLCGADADEDGDYEAPLHATGAFGYVRLRRSRYSDDDLKRWADRFRETWGDAYAIFMQEEDAPTPAVALRFRELVVR